WTLAERWGRVEPDGVVVDLPLTHTSLGFLVGARRPTISRGLKNLAEDGLLVHDRGAWTLAADSRDQLVSDEVPSNAAGSNPSGTPRLHRSRSVSVGARAERTPADRPTALGGVNAVILLVGTDRRATGMVAERHTVRYAAEAAAAARAIDEL